MLILTSFSPKRLERQQQCLSSWLDRGHRVRAVQSPGEAETLQQHFSSVEWRETSRVGNLFGKPYLVRIRAMLSDIGDPVILMNSDIEMTSSKEDFEKYWAVPNGDTLKIGIRWDFDPRKNQYSMFSSGIDAFLITPAIADLLPDIGLVMGCPFWDYWIPWELHQRGYRIETLKHLCLVHEQHELNWSNKDYATARELVREFCGVSERDLDKFIQRQTGREKLRAEEARKNRQKKMRSRSVFKRRKK